MSDAITILLVDDHALFRESLGQLLEAEQDFKVIGTVGDAEKALQEVLDCGPDIVLMDIDMPGLICFDAAYRIAGLRPATRIIFLSAFFHDHYIEEALRVKARGYLTKSEPLGQVVKAIRIVAGGRVYFSPEVQSRIVADKGGVRLAVDEQKPPRTRMSTLSAREIEVLRYLARGMSKKEIASTMHISLKTVEGHAEKLMSKLDIHDRVELTRFAIREGLAEA